MIRSGEARLVGWSRNMLYSGFIILPRSVIRRQTGFAARITRTLFGFRKFGFQTNIRLGTSWFWLSYMFHTVRPFSNMPKLFLFSLLAFAIHLPSETTAQAVAKPLATPTVSQLVRTAKMFELKSNQKLTDIELFEKLGLPPSSVELRGFSSSLTWSSNYHVKGLECRICVTRTAWEIPASIVQIEITQTREGKRLTLCRIIDTQKSRSGSAE